MSAQEDDGHVDPAKETPLSGGGRTEVARRGDVVFRESGAWTVTVHHLLRHLEGAGFAGAPRVVGKGFDDRGREMLTYIPGTFVHPGPWRDAAMPVLGQMIRALHDATASFRVPEGAVWRPWFGRTLGGLSRTIGHCDLAPWNIVASDGTPVALIDWEVAGPVDPVIELAQACWLNAQLYDDDVAARRPITAYGSRAAGACAPRWLRVAACRTHRVRGDDDRVCGTRCCGSGY